MHKRKETVRHTKLSRSRALLDGELMSLGTPHRRVLLCRRRTAERRCRTLSQGRRADQ